MNEALNERAVALRLGVSPFTLRTWRRLGRGPAYMKFGKAVRYRPEDVDAWMRAMRIERVQDCAASTLTPQ